MQQQTALNQIQCLDNQQIILPIVRLSQQPVQAIDQAHRNIPLEPVLQLEEFPESWIVPQLVESFARRRLLAGIDD
tara:strand:- start:1216 stop:1443 length:228 start_codon:yes stop_codon:yes gene_type:complete